ncbi:MAG: glycosyltransferase family 2 protein [Alphaproteobacteria bacterium]|nr:glycosyltransferase family 2 protein [Alphaproteobacteria bacterium]
MSRDEIQLISLICPVYNEEAAIPIFLKRLRESIKPLRDRYDFELIFTNDGSTDRTMELIKAECAHDKMVQLVTFSRNFGYQASVLSGLQHAAGEAMIVIAVDCEDPPELIPRFIEGWEQGHDIVYGRRGPRPEPWLIQLCRKVFYRLIHRIADSDFVPYMGEFALFTRRVRDVVLSNRSTFMFIRSEIAFAGFSRLAISYAPQPRVGGRSHYNIWGMTKFAIGNILTSSTFPLRLAAYLGVPLLFLNWLVPVIGVLTGENPLPVWLIALDLNFLVLAAIFVAVYVARIYKDGMDKPKFIIDWDNTELHARNKK